VASWLSYGLLFVAGALLPAQSAKVYASPDRALRAVVTTNATAESQVEIQTPAHRVLLRRDDRSKDGEHGSGIGHAAWTADSQFFVASTEASGGHQPWARPIWVYSRATNAIVDLSKLGVAATVDFQLRPPDIIAATVNCPAGNRPLTLSLRRLVSDGGVQKRACPDHSSARLSGKPH
jgi:hypothetical protein